MVKTYNVSLDPEVVTEAKEVLEVGQSFSAVINDLLKKWIQKKKEDKEWRLQYIVELAKEN